MSAQSATEREAIVRRRFEAINDGDVDELVAGIADDFVGHGFGGSKTLEGPEAYATFIEDLHEAFDELYYEIEDVVAGTDTMAVRWTVSGVHEGTFLGVEPTGTTVETTGMTVERFDGDQVVEMWVNADLLSVMEQLEAIELPAE